MALSDAVPDDADPERRCAVELVVRLHMYLLTCLADGPECVVSPPRPAAVPDGTPVSLGRMMTELGHDLVDGASDDPVVGGVAVAERPRDVRSGPARGVADHAGSERMSAADRLPPFGTEFHRRMAAMRDSRRFPLLTAWEAETISDLLCKLADHHQGEDLGAFATELAVMLRTRLEELGDLGHEPAR
jgi:hypothetical protein